MLDIKRIRDSFEEVKSAVELRGKGDYQIGRTVELDEERRKLLAEMEALRAEQKRESKRIPQMKKAGEDTTELMAEMKKLADQISELDGKVKEVQEEQRDILLGIPNTPSPTTPVGADETENIEIRRHLEPRQFDFEPKAHWDIGTDLDILDFDRGAKLSGARFTVYKGKGARLERSLINFMLNTHVEEQGYTEILPPFLVGRKAMTGTGQLPKFEDDMFFVQEKDEFLIPTAEVPLTNLRSDEIIDNSELPLYYTAYTACFRKEAGSAGRDTRGIIRQHQFNKVEMVKLVRPEESYEELEKLTNDAESILQKLGLPYRVITLCTGDIGFSAAKTYDVEVWMPSYGRYVEISSCSNTEDFQARRANIRFRREPKAKPEYVHTLNGSGLAVGRCLAAILENYQNEDGSVTVPEALRPYMGCDVIEGK